MMEVQAVSASAVERSCPSTGSEVRGHVMAPARGLCCRAAPAPTARVPWQPQSIGHLKVGPGNQGEDGNAEICFHPTWSGASPPFRLSSPLRGPAAGLPGVLDLPRQHRHAHVPLQVPQVRAVCARCGARALLVPCSVVRTLWLAVCTAPGSPGCSTP